MAFKQKLILMALALVFFSMLVSTAFMSSNVRKQNTAATDSQLEKTFTMITHDLVGRINTFSGAEVNVYAGSKLSIGSSPDYPTLDAKIWSSGRQTLTVGG